MTARTLLFALLCSFTVACVSEDGADDPSPEEISDLDTWATTADGKADLPPLLQSTVDWLTDVYMNRMSAIWNNQEHPASATAAITRTSALARAGGVTDPTRALYPTYVQRLHAGVIDHSEIDIVVSPGHVVRLVGDPKGAGLFVDTAKFADTVGTPLCLTWTELQTAITTSYQPGHYALDFVCHTITEKVLRSLGVGTSTYSNQIKTYAVARWMWGPILPSFNSQTPSQWAVSRTCR